MSCMAILGEKRTQYWPRSVPSVSASIESVSDFKQKQEITPAPLPIMYVVSLNSSIQ